MTVTRRVQTVLVLILALFGLVVAGCGGGSSAGGGGNPPNTSSASDKDRAEESLLNELRKQNFQLPDVEFDEGKTDRASVSVWTNVSDIHTSQIRAHFIEGRWQFGCFDRDSQFVSFAEDPALLDAFYNFGDCPPAYKTLQESAE